MLTLRPSPARRHPAAPPSTPTPPSTDPRPALRATATLFVLVGALLGSWAAVVPSVSARVGVGHAALGTALLAMAAGALAGMQLAGHACSRWGAGRTTTVAAALASVGVVLPGLVATLPALGVALVVLGATTGAANVAVNTLGVDLQRSAGRPVMSLLHAGFSFGGLAGATLGGFAYGVVPVGVHLLLVGVAGLAATYALSPTLTGFRPVPAGAEDVTAPARPGTDLRPLVLLLGAAAGCTAVAEGAVTDWGSLHLHETLHASPATAALGYAGFSLSMGAARLAGRRLVLRHGDTRVQVAGAVLGSSGMALAALAPTPTVALLGFLVAGLGMANVFPLAIGRAGLLAGPRGVSRASTVGYTGLLGGPPVIGLLAELWGLRAALVVVAGVVLAVAGLATTVERRLGGRASVAAALRRQARAQLRATARRGDRMLRSHAESVQLILDQRAPYSGSRRPISDTFPY